MIEKIRKIVLGMAIALSMFALLPSESLAFNEANYTVTAEGDWEVNSGQFDGGPTVQVSMYMLVYPEWANKDFNSFYRFYCTEGEFTYNDGRHMTEAGMIYKYKSENADCIEIYDGIEVWHWDFMLYPGTYIFTEPGGLDKMYFLTQSLGSSLRGDGYTSAEEIVVTEGEEIRLYCMLGEWEWAQQDEQWERLMTYAQEREYKLMDTEDIIAKEKAEPNLVIEVEGMEEETEEVMEEITAEEPSTEESTIEVVEEPVQTENKDSKLGSFMTVLGCIIVFGALIYIGRKNKNS